MLQKLSHKEHYHQLILLHYLKGFQDLLEKAISFVKLM